MVDYTKTEQRFCKEEENMSKSERIAMVQTAMGQVAVAGPENWNRMLAAWQELERIKEELKNEGTETSVQQRNSENAADPV